MFTKSDTAEMTQRHELLVKFESAWQAGEAPSISSYVASLGEAFTDEDRRGLVHELVAIDIRHRWQRSESHKSSPPQPDELPPRPSLADYAERYPEMGPVHELPASLIREEYHVRRRRDEPITPTDFQARFAGRDELIAEFARIDRDLAHAPTMRMGGRYSSTPVRAAAPAPDRPPDVPERVGRFRIEEEIARGGMGQIVRVWDEQFERPLALKVFALKGHEDLRESERTALCQRFEHEARLTGQLQHPGVPPVQERGCLDDGRPYFVMKLIKGHSLAALLRDRSDCSEDLAHYITIFKSVCDTLAYAHSLNILHRDLKPDNIMVGAFGEVQVMDWGLAKVIRESDHEPAVWPASSSVSTHFIVRSASSPVELTSPLDVLGTPAYLPPEQSRGEVERLDPRSDVFGLGGILCMILTGKPPFARDTARENVLLSMQNDLTEAFARLDGCGADDELIGIAKRCLAPNMSSRPSDAGVVAQEIAGHTERAGERLRKAEADRRAAQVQAIEERKRRRLTTILATVTLAAMFVAGFAFRRAEQLRADRIKETADEVHRHLATASSLRAQAEKVLLLDPESPAMWDKAVEEAALAEGLVGQFSGTELYERVLREASTLRDEAAVVAKDRLMLQNLEAAREMRGVLTDDDYLKTNPRAVIVFGHAGTGAYADAFRRYGVDLFDSSPEKAAELIGKQAIRDELVAALDDWLALEMERPRAQRLIAISSQADPDGYRNRLRHAVMDINTTTLLSLADESSRRDLPVRTTLLLADGLHLAGELGEAVRLLRHAQRVHPDDFWINDILGVYLLNHDPTRADEAAQYFAAAVALRPKAYFVYDNLATTLARRGRWQEAIDAYDTAIRLNEDFLTPYLRKSSVLSLQGDLDSAIRLCEEVLRRKPNYPWAQLQLATLWAQKGEAARAVALVRQLIEISPNSPIPYLTLGTTLLAGQQYEEARDAFQKALHFNPNSLEAQLGTADAYLASNDFGKAQEALDTALARYPKYPEVYMRMAALHFSRGQAREAARACRRAVALQPEFWISHLTLARYCYSLGAKDEAIAELQEVVRLEPDSALVRHYVGSVYQALGELDDAIQQFQEAVARNPQNADAHLQLGLAWSGKGLFDSAQESFRKVLGIDPNHSAAHLHMGTTWSNLGDLDAARTSIEEAIRLAPNFALARWSLARLLQEAGEARKARDELQRAIDLTAPESHERQAFQTEMENLKASLDYEARLPEIVSDPVKVTDLREGLRLGTAGRVDQYFAASTAYFTAALEYDREAAEVTITPSDWFAFAQAAVRASEGQGNDPPDLDQRSDYRRKALFCLHNCVSAHRQNLQQHPEQYRYVCQRSMRQLEKHLDFAAVRPPALDQMPEAERHEWESFWGEVDELLQQAEQAF